MIETKILQAEKRFKELSDRLTHPETFSNSSELQKISKEHADLEPLARKIEEFRRSQKEREEAVHLAQGAEPEMKSLAESEIPLLDRRIEEIQKELKTLLLPKDPNGDRNALIEIRAGTGGHEAALFAADLFRMYSRYIERIGMKVELMDSSPTDLGGFKEIVFMVMGKGAFGRFRFESGTHRVQRVPATEASGRIHTSAATVAVLPEVDEVDVEIKDSDLRIDTFCSSGAGGQSVNTTYSAVRITHLPSGIVVQCQDERSQLKNKAKAMKVLYARLKERADVEAQAKVSATRKSQVGSGDRSEKIRTYNFPQNRVTDHRIGMTLYQLDKVMEGYLDEFVEALALARQEELLKEEG
ncbi:MAG TPA: peptide chain release factor 1 [bacterium]|nr:peptide chain release factor 1 [bacterium]